MNSELNHRTKSRGRPESTPLEYSQRQVVKAKIDVLSTLHEFNLILCLSLTDKSSLRGKEVIAISKDRLAIAKSIETVLTNKKVINKEIRNETEVNQKKVLTDQLKELKTQEKELFDQLYFLPELGATQAEWDTDYDDDLKKRPLGRPGLTPEIKVVRTQNTLDESIVVLRELERKEGINTPFEFEKEAATKHLASLKGHKDKGPGRPALDQLGKMDKKILLIEKKIQIVVAGEDVKSVISTSSNNIELGRKARSKEDKLKDLTSQKNICTDAINKIEATLPRSGILSRKLKKVGDLARKYKIAANNAVSSEDKKERFLKYKMLRNQVLSLRILKQEALENEIRSEHLPETPSKIEADAILNIPLTAQSSLEDILSQEKILSQKVAIMKEIKLKAEEISPSKNKIPMQYTA